MAIKKYKNEDGKIAVLYSPGYGAGWSTWNSTDKEKEELVFCYEIIELLLSGMSGQYKEDKLEVISKRLFPGVYTGGLDSLEICWLNPGTAFVINEYDGFESVSIVDDSFYMVA